MVFAIGWDAFKLLRRCPVCTAVRGARDTLALVREGPRGPRTDLPTAALAAEDPAPADTEGFSTGRRAAFSAGVPRGPLRTGASTCTPAGRRTPAARSRRTSSTTRPAMVSRVWRPTASRLASGRCRGVRGCGQGGERREQDGVLPGPLSILLHRQLGGTHTFHVQNADGEIKIWLDTFSVLVVRRGMSADDERSAVRIVRDDMACFKSSGKSMDALVCAR